MSNAVRILLALALGLILGMATGAFAPDNAESAAAIADPVGTLWLNGLRMTIVPLVVSLLITGIATAVDSARAGTLAARSLMWFIGILWASSIMAALVTPLLLDLIPLPAESAAALRGALSSAPPVADVPPIAEFVRQLVPTNPVSAAANDAILPLIVFTTAFAFAITRLAPGPRQALTGFFQATADAMLVVIGWVLALAPIGVFALAFVVGARAGTAAFGALLHYVAIVSAVGMVVVVAAYAVAALAGRVGVVRFAREVAPAQALAISTQSSLACLPIMLARVEALGVPAAKAGVVLPLAVALFRATGPAMNLAVALYVAHWFGVELGPAQIAAGIATAAITTMGAVSLPGQVSFVTSIAPISLAMGVPIEPLALLIAVETLPDLVRTLGNVSMDVAVTTAVDRQTPALDTVPVAKGAPA